MKKVKSILRGECPNCNRGEVFKHKGNLLTLRVPLMNDNCPICKHRFEIEPGYFVGAMYVSYGLTAVEGIAIYILVHSFVSVASVLVLLFLGIVLMSFVNFRYSRIIWMYLFPK